MNRISSFWYMNVLGGVNDKYPLPIRFGQKKISTRVFVPLCRSKCKAKSLESETAHVIVMPTIPNTIVDKKTTVPARRPRVVSPIKVQNLFFYAIAITSCKPSDAKVFLSEATLQNLNVWARLLNYGYGLDLG